MQPWRVVARRRRGAVRPHGAERADSGASAHLRGGRWVRRGDGPDRLEALV